MPFTAPLPGCIVSSNVLNLSLCFFSATGARKERIGPLHCLSGTLLFMPSVFLWDNRPWRGCICECPTCFPCFSLIYPQQRVEQRVVLSSLENLLQAQCFLYLPCLLSASFTTPISYLSGGSVSQCKHQLAAKVADALQRCVVTEVPDVVLTQILLENWEAAAQASQNIVIASADEASFSRLQSFSARSSRIGEAWWYHSKAHQKSGASGTARLVPQAYFHLHSGRPACCGPRLLWIHIHQPQNHKGKAQGAPQGCELRVWMGLASCALLEAETEW